MSSLPGSSEAIIFYLYGVRFVHKTKPDDQARNYGSMAYRLKREGLIASSKGKKGVSGKVANFFVASSYGKGVVLCEQYWEQLNGENFSSCFQKECKSKGYAIFAGWRPHTKFNKGKESL